MPEKPAIELHRINKKFTNVHAVRDLTLTINQGEIYALIGPNGAGKTTTVKMVTGLLAPSSGEISILGTNIADNPVSAKQNLGYIPDDPFVYEYLTGREFLEFVADIYGIERDEADIRIKELLGLYNLSGLIDGLFSEYSRGNKQKTVIIANLLHQPKVLVIDEPIVGLDVQSQRITLKILRNFTKNGGSIFLCTHTLSVAQEIADRIGIIKEGKLVESGTLTQLRNQAKQRNATLEELYLKITGKEP